MPRRPHLVLGVGPRPPQQQHLGALGVAVLTRQVEGGVTDLRGEGGEGGELYLLLLHWSNTPPPHPTQKDSLRSGSEVEGFRSEVVGLGSEVVGLGSEVVGLGSEVVGLGSEVVGLRSEVVGLRSEVEGLRSQVRGCRVRGSGSEVSVRVRVPCSWSGRWLRPSPTASQTG